MIKIADNLSLPVEVVTQTVSIIAKRRAGKSYTARRIAEELHSARQQIVIVDPKGDWWGIRSSDDGKRPGLNLIILGGEHGDVPLESGAGEIVAKLVVEERVSIVLDLSFFRKYEIATFMAIFLETLYRLKAKEQYRTPVMLVIDEADAIAPQRPQKGEERMLGAAEDIVRRGGQRGIGCCLVTQRSAVLNKNVLTQSQIIVALRTIAPQDIAALDAWIEVHGTQAERAKLLESIASLPIGDAWFWSPGWPGDNGIFKRVHVLPIRSYDSGATPKPGEKRAEPSNPAHVDLEALKRQMAATIEKAKADDPKELRKKIADLENQLKHRPVSKHAQESLDEWKKQNAELRHQASFLQTRFDQYQEGVGDLLDWFTRMMDEFGRRCAKIASSKPIKPVKDILSVLQDNPSFDVKWVPMSRSKPSRNVPPGNGKLPEGEYKILVAAVQHGAVGRDQLSVLTGYKRSTRDAYIARLMAKGYLDVVDGMLEPSKQAALDFPNVEPLPTGAALRDYWLNELPEGESRVLHCAIAVYPKAVDREFISDKTGFKRSTRDAYISRLKARRLVDDTAPGQIIATEVLFQ
jgi:hypothetical protein